jgi:uncharacterized protein DUF2092
MLEALRAADSLSYESHYYWEAGGRQLVRGTYRIGLKKPNYARLEAYSGDEVSSVLILDGEQLWIYWANERPRFTPGDDNEEEWRRTCRNVYMKKPAPPARHSIGHEVVFLVPRVVCILDPSTFHGYTDSLQPYLDGVQSIGREQVDGEECDGIEVSFMDHQRSWYLWLSRHDLLPRQLKQVVRVAESQTSAETWSNVKLDADISQEAFSWRPPDGWHQWRPQTPEEQLIKPGTPAPDFSLSGLQGESISLSQFRGKPVWLVVWRAG